MWKPCVQIGTEKKEFEVHCHIVLIAHFIFIILLLSLHMVEKHCNRTAYL